MAAALLSDTALVGLLYAAAERPEHCSRELYPFLLQAASALQRKAQTEGAYRSTEVPAIAAMLTNDIDAGRRLLTAPRAATG